MEVGINFFIALFKTGYDKKPQKPYKMTSADIFCLYWPLAAKLFTKLSRLSKKRTDVAVHIRLCKAAKR